jgi:hypothetical protein
VISTWWEPAMVKSMPDRSGRASVPPTMVAPARLRRKVADGAVPAGTVTVGFARVMNGATCTVIICGFMAGTPLFGADWSLFARRELDLERSADSRG